MVKSRIVKDENRKGSRCAIKDLAVNHSSGSLAQSVEQLTFNQLVAGSNPARPTNS
ncbi:hypothetical protein YERSI8AC_100329 [Enterobacterales bacterium 8AC]|nr:hypothetical protein YERSI8AC_100329 [Enterobacterales bacterium 8AC]